MEQALLIEAHTVLAATLLRLFVARATDLNICVSEKLCANVYAENQTNLSLAAVLAGYGSPLTGRRWLRWRICMRWRVRVRRTVWYWQAIGIWMWWVLPVVSWWWWWIVPMLGILFCSALCTNLVAL